MKQGAFGRGALPRADARLPGGPLGEDSLERVDALRHREKPGDLFLADKKRHALKNTSGLYRAERRRKKIGRIFAMPCISHRAAHIEVSTAKPAVVFQHGRLLHAS